MDGPETPYREKFEKLGRTDEGEIVAIITSSLGDRFVESETDILGDYQTSKAFLELLQGDEDLQHSVDVNQEARAAIQAYKKRHGIPLDTPPVEETPPIRPFTYTPAANDENHGADILTPDF